MRPTLLRVPCRARSLPMDVFAMSLDVIASSLVAEWG